MLPALTGRTSAIANNDDAIGLHQFPILAAEDIKPPLISSYTVLMNLIINSVPTIFFCRCLNLDIGKLKVECCHFRMTQMRAFFLRSSAPAKTIHKE